jgi:hypothetical protein
MPGFSARAYRIGPFFALVPFGLLTASILHAIDGVVRCKGRPACGHESDANLARALLGLHCVMNLGWLGNLSRGPCELAGETA